MNSIRHRLVVLIGGSLLLFLLATSSLWIHTQDKESLVIGAKASEGAILAEIFSQFIEHELGIPVARASQMEGTFIIFNALCVGQIDLYVEYSGTALSAILKKEVKGKSSQEIQMEVKEGLNDCGVIAFPPLGFQNRYALLMTPEKAEKYAIATLSDLISKVAQLEVGFDQEFYAREEFKILQNQYRIPFEEVKLMDHALLYLTLQKEGCDLINGYSTDGFAMGLMTLEDDQGLFPSYEAIPIASKKALTKHPGLEATLKRLEGKISNQEMQEMNYAVEKKGESYYDVAKTFLVKHALIPS